MTKYLIGPLSDNSSQVFVRHFNVDVIKTINVEEKPLLDKQDAEKLAVLATAILILGTLVQVRFFREQNV